MHYLTMWSLIFSLFFGNVMPKRVQAEQVKLNAALATPVMLADKKQTVYLQVRLTGFTIKNNEIAPVNVGLIIDKSGSMQGEKIRRAKEAAIMAVKRLRNQDILSVVTYDYDAKVLLPATKAQDREKIIAAIEQLTAGGQTALFDGLKTGAKEVRKFLDPTRVNRMVLVSDGLANVGPSTPQALGSLATSLSQENMTITTIGLGLGYNEDLMTQLAQKSDGNHAFAKNAQDLLTFFDHEFGDILSVVAQEVKVTINAADGIRPVRVLAREADIQEKEITIKLNQLYSEQEKYILVELEIPATPTNTERQIASVTVAYRNMDTNTNEHLTNTIAATFTNSAQIVTEKTNATVMTAVIEQLAVEKNQLAIKLRDEGQIEQAKAILLDNATYLAEEAAKYDSKKLETLKELNIEDSKNLDEDNWGTRRKSMRREQYKSQNQQTY